MKHIFVFGAGASADHADLPLGHELIWEYEHQCRLLSTYNHGRVDNTVENKRFENLQEFIRLAETVYPEIQGELQRFLNRGLYPYIPSFKGKKKYYVDEMLAILQAKGDAQGVALVRLLILEHITRRIIQLGLDYAPQLYDRFKSDVLTKFAPDSVSVISFNFDTLLCEHFRKPVSFDYLLKFDRIFRSEPYKAKTPIPLLKLHGSLDWGIASDGTFSLFSHYINTIEKYEGSEPLIIMPHQNRLDALSPIWERAAHDLQRAHKLTVIGYSFPDYDTEVINLFRNSLQSDALIEVIDFCEHPDYVRQTERRIRAKYASVFPHLQKAIQIRLDGFSGYLSDFTVDSSST